MADRGMIRKETLADLTDPSRRCHYVPGARMRPAEEVRVCERRYIVCYNEEKAFKERQDRAAILESLSERLRKGDKSLVGNKGYRKYLKTPGVQFEID